MQKIKTVLYVTILLSLAGCGLWGNFTTYFNVYFNTKEQFETGIDVIEKEPKPTFEFKEPQLPAAAKTAFDKVIEKGSKVLERGLESAYFDDALFMVGQAMYFQGEFPKALRKFNELEQIENSDYRLEAGLWQGKTQFQLREFKEGFNKLEVTRHLADSSERLIVRDDIYISQISYLIYREDYKRATLYCDSLFNKTQNPELKAEVIYQQGKLYYVQDKLDSAVFAFDEVVNFDAKYETEINSKIEKSLIIKELGKVDSALMLFDDLRSEPKYEEDWGKIDLEIGKIYLDRDNIDDALDKLYFVDTTYTTQEYAGVASFLLGEIWEKHYMNYDTAMQYYDKTIASKTTPDYKSRARRKNRDILKYISLNEDLLINNRDLSYIIDPYAFKDDSLAYVGYQEKQDSIKEERKNNPTGRTTNNPFGQKREKPKLKPLRPRISEDSLNIIVGKIKYDLGNIFFTELDVPDSAHYYYTDVIINYPDHRMVPKAVFALGSYYSTQGDSIKADSLYRVVYDKYQNDDIVNEAARKLGEVEIASENDPAEIQFLTSEKLFLKSELDSSITEFYKIYNDYPKSEYASKALYSIGWILENEIVNPDSAIKVYKLLNTKYRRTKYAKKVRPKITMFDKEQKRIVKAVQDSLANFKKEQLADSLANIKMQKLVDSLTTGETQQLSDSLRNSETQQLSDSTATSSDVEIDNKQ